MSETYDDNVDRVEDGRDDFETTVRLGLTLRARSPWLAGNANYSLDTAFFAKGTKEQGELTHNGSMSLTYLATPRLTLSVADSVRYAETSEIDARLAVPPPAPGAGDGPVPAEPPPAVEPGAPPTRRVRQLGNTAIATFDYRYSALTRAGAAYEYSVVRYGDPELIDSDTHRVSLRSTQQVTLSDQVGLAYEFAFFQFDRPGAEDRQAHSASVLWNRALSEWTTADLALGATLTERETGSRFASPAVTGRIAFARLAERVRYTASYARSVTTSGGEAGVQRRDIVAAGVAGQLTARLEAEAGAAYTRGRDVDGAPGIRETYSATIGLTRRIAKSVRGFLAYTFERSEAPPGATSFRQNRITIGAAVTLGPFGTPAVGRGAQ